MSCPPIGPLVGSRFLFKKMGNFTCSTLRVELSIDGVAPEVANSIDMITIKLMCSKKINWYALGN